MTKKQKELLLDLIADASEDAADIMIELDDNEKVEQQSYIDELEELHQEVEKIRAS